MTRPKSVTDTEPADSFTAPPPEPAPEPKTRKPRGPRKERKASPSILVDEAAVDKLHVIVSSGVLALCMFVKDPYKLTPDEIDGIFRPAERIYLRHYSVPNASPDMVDGAALGFGVIGYGLRVLTSTGKLGGYAPPHVTGGPGADTSRTSGHSDPPRAGSESEPPSDYAEAVLGGLYRAHSAVDHAGESSGPTGRGPGN